MRKAIKLCLALAMACTMAAPAFAGETSATVTGEAEFYFSSTTADYQDASGDKKSASAMDMSHSGGLYLDVTDKGDVWTTTFGIGIWIDQSSVALDAANVGISNDTFGLNFGSSDLGDATKNPGYYEGALYDVGDELDKGGSGVMFTMGEVGLGAYLAINTTDASTKSAYGVSFDKVMGDLDLSVEYETFSVAINKDKAAVTTATTDDKDGALDGASASDLGIGVKYSMGAMAFMFNYGMTSTKDGGKAADANTAVMKSRKAKETTTMMVFFDMALDDASGISAKYEQRVLDDKDSWVQAAKTGNEKQGQKTTTTNMGVGYKTMINSLWIGGFYETSAEASDNADWQLKSGVQKDYAKKTKSTSKIGLEVGMSFY